MASISGPECSERLSVLLQETAIEQVVNGIIKTHGHAEHVLHETERCAHLKGADAAGVTRFEFGEKSEQRKGTD